MPVISVKPSVGRGLQPLGSFVLTTSSDITESPSAWVAILAIALFWILLAVLYFAVIRNTHGNSVYVLDDPYISAAMAKNLVQHGVLGVTRYGFSSSSSSIVWPFLIAGSDLVLGVHPNNAFLLNIGFGTLLIIFCHRILVCVEPDARPAYIFLCLICIILLTPLPGLVFVGLEHILHAIATVGFAYVASLTLSLKTEPGTSRTISANLLLFAMMVTLSRFEGIFIIVIVTILFVFRRRWTDASGVACAGAIPILLFGAFSKLAGWEFLPNSVLIKGGSFGDALRKCASLPDAKKLLHPSDVQFICLIASILFILGVTTATSIWDRKQLMLLIFIGTTLLHLKLASVGWFFRYEAYLMPLGVLAIGGVLYQYFEQIYIVRSKVAIFAYALIVVLLIPGAKLFRPRSLDSLVQIPMAAKNIYDQQYQMARFLKKYYSGATVAANDIGAVNYFADIHCLDLYGLASVPIEEMKHARNFNSQSMAEFVRQSGGQIAIIYDDWYDMYGGVPSQWTLMGRWRIDNNVVAANDTVSFYATDPSQQPALMRNLANFSAELPHDVVQETSALGNLGPRFTHVPPEPRP
jgi:hypothetical protein